MEKILTEIGEYKGNPTITLGSGGKYPFTFGITKAKMILECLDDIKAFIDSYEKPPVRQDEDCPF
jgi:hypothetical protein